MKHKRTLITMLLLIATLLILSCSLFEPDSSAPPTPTQPLAEPIPPTDVPAEEPSATYLPVGIAANKSEQEKVTVYDRDGYTLIEISTPGMSYSNPANVHVAGTFTQGNSNLPILYYAFEQNNSLLLSHNQQVTTLISIPYFADLVGAPGTDIIAYSIANYDNNLNALRTQLFVGASSALANAAPVLTEDDPQGWAVVALSIGAENGSPVGVWYSKRPWGIGGDIVFEPRRSLFYLDLATGTSSQILGAEANPSALSDDQSWIAYTDDTNVGSGAGAMSIRNLQSGANVTFSLLPASEPRGAGTATFSPSNQYLAWMEGNGWQMAEIPNFHSVVRVGDLDGNIVAEIADTALVTVAGLGRVSRVEPVGWFDDHSLVIMARGEVWDQASLLLVDIPSQTTSFLASGVFLGFVYP